MRRSDAEREQFLSAAAQEARDNLTPEQRIVWDRVKDWGFVLEHEAWGATKNGGRYPYRIDIYHPKLKLAVEIDGRHHKTRLKGRDRRRTSRLRYAEGIEVIRLTNREVIADTAGSIERIRLAMDDRLPSPS